MVYWGLKCVTHFLWETWRWSSFYDVQRRGGHSLYNWGTWSWFLDSKSCTSQPVEGTGLSVCVYGGGCWEIFPRHEILYPSSRLTGPVTMVPRSKPKVLLYVASRKEPGVWSHLDLGSMLIVPLWIWVINLTSQNLSLFICEMSIIPTLHGCWYPLGA